MTFNTSSILDRIVILALKSFSWSQLLDRGCFKLLPKGELDTVKQKSCRPTQGNSSYYQYALVL